MSNTTPPAVKDDPTLLKRVRGERVTVLYCCLHYLPPDDPVHLKARQLFLPMAKDNGVHWISDPRRRYKKLFLNEENIATLQTEFPEWCPR